MDLDCYRSQFCGSDRTYHQDWCCPTKEQTEEGERKKASKQESKQARKEASKKGSGSFNDVFCLFFHVEEDEEAEIHAAASDSQRLLPVQQVLPPLPVLCVIQ